MSLSFFGAHRVKRTHEGSQKYAKVDESEKSVWELIKASESQVERRGNQERVNKRAPESISGSDVRALEFMKGAYER